MHIHIEHSVHILFFVNNLMIYECFAVYTVQHYHVEIKKKKVDLHVVDFFLSSILCRS